MMKKKSKTVTQSIFRILWHIYDFVRWLIILAALLLILLFLCGIRPYIVQSGSMEPAIMTGSVCFVNHHAKYENVRTGDIITFRLGNDDIATHRAVAVTDDGIRTKGDANETEDAALVTEDIFVGETIGSIPELGYFITALRTGNGILMTAAFILFLLLFGRLLETFRENKK